MSSAIVRALLTELELDDHAAGRIAELVAERLQLQSGPASPWMDVDECAAYLRATRQRVYDLRHSGALKAHRDGRRLLFHVHDVDGYIRGLREGA